MGLKVQEDADPEPVYQVLARQKKGAKMHKLTAVAKLHAEAIESYRTRHFSRAAKLFQEVGDTMIELTGVDKDVASNVLMKRCNAYAGTPPRTDWNGVWDQANEPS